MLTCPPPPGGVPRTRWPLRGARTYCTPLARVLDGRTVVAVAHRLHTAHDADVIAVVEGGRISELGSHHQLVEADGAYAALWRSWHG